eukprot:767408-Hanusia_phi.AAC.5
MGKHYCKMCCRAHVIPPISSMHEAFDASSVPKFSWSAVQLADLEPGSMKRAGSVELVGVDSDFSQEHTIITIQLDVQSSVVTDNGFWTRVFEGRMSNGKKVILKVYKQQSSHTQRQVFDRFHRELLALGTLGEHRCFVKCLGFGFTCDLWPFLVLEHAGTPLSNILPKSRLNPKEISRQLLRAIETAHLLGLCHNDLTLDNVLIFPLERPKLGRWYKRRSLRFLVKVIDWNSVEDASCVFEAGPRDQKLCITDVGTETLNIGETERNPIIRDCQAVGNIILRCVDGREHERIFAPCHLGTLQDWNAAAQKILNSSLKEDLRSMLSKLFDPRCFKADGNRVVYPISVISPHL